MPFLKPENVRHSGNHQDMLNDFGVIAYERQLSFEEQIRNKDWNFVVDSGKIIFGGDLKAEAQLIGSFAKEDKTWMWAWANEQAGFPNSLMSHSLRLKEIGDTNGIPQFTTPIFDADERVAHMFSLIASGMFGASAYYPADYGDGYLFITLSSPEVDEYCTSKKSLPLFVFSQFIMTFPLNHKMALRSFLRAKDYEVREENLTLVAVNDSETTIIEFDEQDRMVSLGGNVSSKKQKKKWWFF